MLPVRGVRLACERAHRATSVGGLPSPRWAGRPLLWGYHPQDLEGVRVELGALPDAELVDLARQGSAPAFAVLLHRHGPAVRAVVDNDDDPAGAVISTYVRAMRRLEQLPDNVPARTWLLELAADEVRDPLPVGDGRLPDLHPDERDEIWAELDVRWPNGKVPRRVPHWLGWAALVVALVSLGVLLPYLALTWGADDNDLAWEALRAEPFEDDAFVLEEDEVEEEGEVAEIEFELPSFDFSGNDQPAADPPPETTPPPPPPPPPPVEEEPEVEAPEVEEDPVEDEDDDPLDDEEEDPVDDEDDPPDPPDPEPETD